MESEWADSELGKLVRLQRGHDLTDGQRRQGNVPVMGSAGQNGFHDTSRAKGPGIVLGRSGASFGKVHYSEHDYWPHNTALYVTDFLGNDELFTYHLLKTVDFSSYNTGSAQPSLNRNHLYSIPVSIPPLPEQKAIAHILGSLDDKIELNRKMNATLEAMAQALFKSWFVDFDPVIDNALRAGNPIPDELAPRAEIRKKALAGSGEPSRTNGTANEDAAKDFPSAFQETEELGWIPEGWEAGSILEKAKLLSGGTPKTSISEYWDGDIPWASAKDVSQCGESFLINSARQITETGLAKSSTKIIPEFSTVFVARGATTGRLTMFGSDMAMNQTCYGLRSYTGMHFYTYCHSKHFIDSIVNAGHGSIFTTITTKTFEASKVIHADETIISNFEKLAAPIFQKIRSNQLESSTLTKLRDTLLPKLISGELQAAQ